MLRQTAEGWLKNILGADATFRAGQWEAIEALVARQQRVLVVQRTGWGKSLVYFVATRLMREQGRGVTLLISPLLALVRNQIQAAAQYGVRAESINSTNYDDHARIERDLLAGKIDLLLISPERLANDRFQSTVWKKLKQQVGMLVVDEAHCISDWGHDFRPNYRRIMRVLDELPEGTPVLGTTATANDRVVSDVSEILGAQLNVLRGALTRDSLSLYVYTEPMDGAERLTLMEHLMRSIPGSGIIYCTTTRDCLIVAEWLQEKGFNVKPYYSGVEDDIGEPREALEEQLLNNKLKALVASVALGMGFDKPDLHFVVHFQFPGSIIGYYQQIGRAGRGIDQAYIILMHGPGDEDIQRYFIDTAFPTPEQVSATIEAFVQHGDLKRNDIQRYVNVRYSTLEKILTHLEVEHIIMKVGSTYSLIDASRLPDYDRWGLVTRQRYEELDQMKAYINHDDCLMRFIANALDDPTNVEPCGRCKNCRDSQSKFEVERDRVEQARRYLRQGRPIAIEPRKRWVKGLPGIEKTTMQRVSQEGVALCNYYESGWGEMVKQARLTTGHFPDELVEPSADLLRKFFDTLNTPPQWVTSVPSLRRPNLVPDFARRLADALSLPYHDVLVQMRQHDEQAGMQNSFQQALNVWGVYNAAEPVLRSPVLLVDDVVDSRWTLTVVGNVLMRAGASTVYPFALASASPKS